MKVFFNATCPYCQHVNKFAADPADQFPGRPMVYACDNEEGGCDHYFLVTLKMEPVVIVQTILEELDEYVRSLPEVDESMESHPPLPGE